MTRAPEFSSTRSHSVVIAQLALGQLSEAQRIALAIEMVGGIEGYDCRFSLVRLEQAARDRAMRVGRNTSYPKNNAKESTQ